MHFEGHRDFRNERHVDYFGFFPEIRKNSALQCYIYCVTGEKIGFCSSLDLSLTSKESKDLDKKSSYTCLDCLSSFLDAFCLMTDR